MNINELTDAIRVMARDGRVSTHSTNCWKWHLPCAALYAADLLDAFVEQEATWSTKRET